MEKIHPPLLQFKYLPDTNICIYLIKQRPAVVLDHFQRHTVGKIGLSTITVAELQYGAAKSSRVEQNQQALAPLAIARFDYRATSLRQNPMCIGTPVHRPNSE